MIASDIRRLVTVEFSDTFQCGMDENKIDWLDVQGRVGEALQVSGTDFKDLCTFLGVNSEGGDIAEQVANLPKLRTAMAIAGFLGISFSWLLTGKGQPPYEKKAHALTFGPSNGINGTTESTIVQGNTASNVVINNGVPNMSEQKRELMRIFDLLPLRKQTHLLHLAYEMEHDKTAQ